MNFSGIKPNTKLITLLLMLTIAVSIIALPAAAQEEPTEVESYPYINAIPNPVGVGQTVTLHVGSQWPGGATSEGGWEGLQVIIQKDGQPYTTIDDIKTDSTGGTGIPWTPEETGTYTLTTYFPEQIAPTVFGFQANPPSGATMLESHSEDLELVVLEEPVAYYPAHALPTEYWSRPIDAQIRSWASIAGNWLGDQVSMDASPPAQTLYYDYNENAPETAHVLWTKPLTMGGLAGGIGVTDHGFDQGDAYEPKWTGAVIIGGIVFYNQFETTGSETGLYRPVIAVDLHTGEELWKQQLLDLDGNNLNLDFGQVYFFDGFNQHGVFDYLWTTSGSTWNAYDPLTARWVYTMEGVPSGTRMYGPKGEIYVYSVNLNAGTMTLWDSSLVVSPPAGGAVAQGSFNPQGQIYDADTTTSRGIVWEVPIQTGLPGSVDKVREGIILGTDFDKYSRVDNGEISMWALSIEAG